MIRFLCPECGKHLKAPETSSGKQVKCGRCGRSFQAPAASDPKAQSPSPPVPRLAGLFGGSRTSKSKGRRLLLLGGLIAVGLLAIIVAILFMPGAVDQELMDLKGGDPAKSRRALAELAATEAQDGQAPG